MIGSYPHHDPGHSAPIYLEYFRNSEENRFSCIAEDCLLQEGFGNGKSEAVLPLSFTGDKKLVIWLYGSTEYQPPANRLEKLRLFQQAWDTHFRSVEFDSSAASRFTILGQAGETLGLGVVIVNDNFEIVYRNESFNRITDTPEGKNRENDFRKLYNSLAVCDQNTRPVPFDQSPFHKAAHERRFSLDRLNIAGCERSVAMMAGPLNVADTQLFVYCIMPDHEELSGVDSQNHSGTKLILSVAHDIRAPLITIEAFSKRLQTGYGDQFDADGRFAIDSVVENCRILQDMLEGLGEISQNWLTEEAPECLYPKKIIQELISYLKATYPNTAYQIKIPEGLPDLRAPKRKLVRLFRNILDNAFKYSAAAKHPTVKLDYSLVNGWHQFSITDNGPGIDEDYKQKIFAPFFRTPETVSLPGTGMGLAIVADIIASWGGNVWLDTSYQKGTRISFTLPPRIKG
jgi:signal transduction histidine kinase